MKVHDLKPLLKQFVAQRYPLGIPLYSLQDKLEDYSNADIRIVRMNLFHDELIYEEKDGGHVTVYPTRKLYDEEIKRCAEIVADTAKSVNGEQNEALHDYYVCKFTCAEAYLALLQRQLARLPAPPA